MSKIYRIYLLAIFMVVGLMSSNVYAQTHTLKGVVQDESGNKIVGVAISVKGTGIGVTTMSNGAFTLNLPSKAAYTILVSFLGYETQEINVPASQTDLKIVVKESVASIDEVVVTAFAVQKKVNVTGAISSVGGEALVSSPVSNITSALVGNTPGVSGLQSSGEPGQNGTDIKIRGVATFGSSTPLIVIDGIEQASERAFDELNSMDPNEIANVSVLKDASSTAVYGIRGANGVIIVTTKRGKIGKPVINFSANFGLTMASAMADDLTSYEYGLMRNEAIRNEQRSYSGKQGLDQYIFDDYDLWKFKNNRDYTPVEVDRMNLSPEQKERLKNSPALYYGSRDLYGDLFANVAPQMQGNINVSGGTEKVKYFTSFGFFSQNGIMQNEKYHDAKTGSSFQRYNFRSNFDIQVTKNIKVTINTAGQFGQNQGAGADYDPYDLGGRYKRIMQYIYEGNPFISPGFVDGKLISGFQGVGGSEQNPLAVKSGSSLGDQNPMLSLLTSGMNTVYNTLLDNVAKIEHQMDYLLKGLRIYGTVSYQGNYNRRVKFQPSIPTYKVQRDAMDPTKMNFFGGSIGGNAFDSYGYGNWNKLYIDAGADWSGSFKGHNISALLLAKASRYTMPDDAFNTPSGIMGFVGRVTYNFRNKYMIEFNAGYNGTEQFIEGERFGFFPAVSAGWVPTSEEFFPKNDIVTFIKIRGSYGEVGNDQLSNNDKRRYYYLPNTYNDNSGGYYLGNSSSPNGGNTYYQGAIEGALGNPAITWERAKKYDLGFEFKFFKDKLAIAGDIFKEDRDNILTRVGIIPAIYGVPYSSLPASNVGKTTNSGYEIMANWSDVTRGGFAYSLGFDLSHTRNKIVYMAESPNPYPWMDKTGFAIGQRFGLISNGLYNTQEELANRPYNTYNANQATLGDIRYKDLNGDGMIDNKDVAPIGYPNYPEYHYSVKVNLSYKGFDIKLLFNGAANGSYYLHSNYSMPFYKNAGNAWKWMYDGRWTPEKYASGAKITYPRAEFSPSGTSNNFLSVGSDYWMEDSDFFKLKNVEIGYMFNTSKNRKGSYGLSSMRVYVNANNVYTFGSKRLTDIGIDPERADGSAYIYPLTRIVNVGISLQF